MTERAIRSFFEEHGLLEVSCPSLVRSPGMEPHLRAIRAPLVEAGHLGPRFLHTSPEYAIKATLADLPADPFTLARVYRDEGTGRFHHVEFTMLEWYRRRTSLDTLMNETRALLHHVVGSVSAALGVQDRANAVLPADAPHRMTVQDAFSAFLGIDVLEASREDLLACAQAHDFDCQPDWDETTLFSLLMADGIEPALARSPAVFLHGFPAREAALARLSSDDPRVAERFELYVSGTLDGTRGRGGIELANAFDELVDPAEQRRRFEADLRWRVANGLPAYPMPESMLEGLGRLEPASGIALGVERLVIWLGEALLDQKWSVADLLLGEPTRQPD